MALFSVSERFIDTASMKVIKVTLVIHKVNRSKHVRQNYPVELNFISRVAETKMS